MGPEIQGRMLAFDIGGDINPTTPPPPHTPVISYFSIQSFFLFFLYRMFNRQLHDYDFVNQQH